MDVEQLRELEPKLDRFLERFADCYGRKDTRAHLGVDVRGQLSSLPQKSVEPIALELYDRAVGNGLEFAWLTFDEGYGSKPELLRELATRQQRYVAEVPRSFTGWLEAPRVVTRPYHRGGRGRGRRVPRLASDSRPARSVANWLKDPVLREQSWQRWRVKDGDKGPVVWETKHAFLTVKDEHGLPGARLHLVIARNALNHAEVRFFLSNAPADVGVETLLHVAFSRWRVERCFEDQKSELGLDQYEGRRYLGLKRHLLITAVSYLFLAQVRQEWGENQELTVCQLHTAMAVLVQSWWDTDQSASDRVLDRTAKRLTRQQQRNAVARKSHTKTTKRKLQKLGISLTALPRCGWGRS